jgi:hypothetical protein
MSALPPEADMADRIGNVRFVPKADIALRFFTDRCYDGGTSGRPRGHQHPFRQASKES